MREARSKNAPHVRSYADQTRHVAHRHAVERRCTVEIDVIPLHQQIGDALVPQGKHTVDVPKSVLPVLKEMVRDEQMWASAVARFELDEKAWLTENNNDLDRCPESPSKSYVSMWRKDPGCLRSLKILNDDVDPVGTNQDHAQDRLADQIAEGIGRAMSKPAAADTGALEKRMAQLEAENETLRNVVKDLNKGKSSKS